ncbi:MAG: class I SAM-dependent methyltransferase [Brevinematales bacterium]|nr:class I SAM-dependent methyltransferase [Brevinematales bacterium]
MNMEMFFEVHTGETREGPGSLETTRKAFSYIKGLSKNSEILDAGCGPGWQTLELARLCPARITAIDLHQPFLDLLRRNVDARSYADRFTIRNMSMGEMDFPPESFGLIWSEGAIYNIGFAHGIREFRRFIKTGGYLAVSEASWLKPGAPWEIRDFWNAEYPGIDTIDGSLEKLIAAGYELVAHFTLPDTDWFAYYDPLKGRLDEMMRRHPNDPDAKAYYAMERHEYELFDKYREWYGYVFYIAKKL